MPDLSAQTILVTGSTGRIGAVVVDHLLGRGCRIVAVAGRDPSAASLREARRDEVESGRLQVVVADLRGEDAAKRLVSFLTDADRRPTGVVLAARDVGTLAAVDRASWFDELLLAVVFPHELITALVEDEQRVLEAVVHVSSMYGLVAPNSGLYSDPSHRPPVHYGVAKAAAIHLAKEQAVTLAPIGIRVNAIAYGGVAGRSNDDFRGRYGQLVPNGRMLDDADLPGAVAFLLSPEARGVTAHTLVVDGGWTAW